MPLVCIFFLKRCDVLAGAGHVTSEKFLKNDEYRQKWLHFCGIKESVLNYATKLCSDHFAEDKLIHYTKITFLKSAVLPTITNKKRKKHQYLDNDKLQVITKQRRTIKTLQQNKSRLIGRITSMKGLISHLKQKDLLSETTAENLMVM
ncbi:hypothetical protein PUN28_003761 [Cardiocondyla obscurior]|uniref:THAP-type domain-containing protein n=1 Tax=Cardiocondyla obscurior TaxID=286306 RepID=A0AAW2GP01_9HYME